MYTRTRAFCLFKKWVILNIRTIFVQRSQYSNIQFRSSLSFLREKYIFFKSKENLRGLVSLMSRHTCFFSVLSLQECLLWSLCGLFQIFFLVSIVNVLGKNIRRMWLCMPQKQINMPIFDCVWVNCNQY